MGGRCKRSYRFAQTQHSGHKGPGIIVKGLMGAQKELYSIELAIYLYFIFRFIKNMDTFFKYIKNQ